MGLKSPAPLLSTKQAKFILESTAKINLAHGAVRSGKTLSSTIRWAEFCAGCPDTDLAMVGYSMESIYYNAVQPFQEIYKGFCSYSSGSHVLNFMDKKIRIMGANDQGMLGKIAGATLSGAYVDEMTLLPQNFVDMLVSRCSPSHAKLFGTMNPDTPFHYIKNNFIDKADGKLVYALHFNLEDNPSLDESYKNMLKTVYSGLWYKRYVLGEWCMAEGAIYDCFDRKLHVVKRAPTYATDYIVGVDYGTRNPFGAVLIGINSGHHPGLWVEKELFWNPADTGRQKTDSELSDSLEQFIEGYAVREIYLDPSAQSLEVELRNRRLKPRQAKNDVLNGIRTVANFISQGDLVICAGCTNLIMEIEGYVWDAKKVKMGEDEPLKQRDHLVDALRYAIYSRFGATKKLPVKTITSPPRPAFGEGWGWREC